MRGGLEASRPRASPATDVTGHSTEVLDVDAGFLAEYGNTAAAVKMLIHHIRTRVGMSTKKCFLILTIHRTARRRRGKRRRRSSSSSSLPSMTRQGKNPGDRR